MQIRNLTPPHLLEEGGAFTDSATYFDNSKENSLRFVALFI